MVRDAVEVVAPRTEFRVLDHIKGDKRSAQHDNQQWHADEKKQPLAGKIPLAKENVRDEYNPRHDTCRRKWGREGVNGEGHRENMKERERKKEGEKQEKNIQRRDKKGEGEERESKKERERKREARKTRQERKRGKNEREQERGGREREQ